jgi:serine/threonine protein kinase/Flp pilus assembly protein TadD
MFDSSPINLYSILSRRIKGMQCPKCNSDNPDDSKFCKECGTQLDVSKDAQASFTKTIEKPVDELISGTSFAERYQVLELLGRGGMGDVYKAEDTKLKRTVALKFLPPDLTRNSEAKARFIQEAQAAAALDHPNICTIYEADEAEDKPYISMAYIKGSSLRDRLEKGPFKIEEALDIAIQVAEGLTDAHEKGIMHRDIKSANIMVTEKGQAKIMDFGLAKITGTTLITREAKTMGTVAYMSPEQARGETVDHRTDIWSLGVVLYEMLSGKLPFKGDREASILYSVEHKEPKHLKELDPSIPTELADVVGKALAKNPEERYPDAEALLDDLRSISKGLEPIKIKALARKLRFARIKRVYLYVGIVALMMASVIIWRLIPQKDVVLPPKIENSIAVISFENQTGDKAFDFLQKAIPNLLITNLENTGFFYVATWERMDDLIKQLGKKDVEVIDKDLGFELCQREGIEAIVLGSFVKAGETFATDVKVLDVETKKLLKSASSRGRSVDSILETQIDELSKEISHSIGISETKIETANLRVADVTTTSMEAYNYFLRGREAFEKYYFDEARQFFEKAVEIDATFASAYLGLAGAYDWLGDINAMNDALGKAKTYSEKITEKERLYIEASYAGGIEKDPEKMFTIFKQMAKKYPKEKQVHYYLGNNFGVRGMFNEAIEEHNKALELDPSFGEALNMLAYIYSEMGDYEKGIEYFQRFAAVSPGDANPFDGMGEMYLKMGKLDEAIAKYKEALKIKPDFPYANWSLGYIYALKENYSEALKWVDQYIVMAPSLGIRAEGNFCKGFYRYWLGSLEQSLSDLHRAAELAEEVGNVYWKANVEWMKGWIHYDQEELELSRKCNETWLDAYLKSLPEKASFYKSLYSLNLGFIGLKEGQVDQAKTRLAEVKALLPDLISIEKETISLLIDYLHAEVLLAEGFPEKAIAVCEKTLPLGLPLSGLGSIYRAFYNVPFLRDVLARAYLQNGELDKAVMKYEQLITFDPNSKDRRLMHPKFHYRLAKLYEQKGSKAKAIEHYEKFLDLWKDADPGIVEVDDARERRRD